MDNLLKDKPEMRDAIINAALEEYVKYGYESASTNRIAQKAGYSKQLILHYVKNKEGLFRWTLDFFKRLLDEKAISKIDDKERDYLKRVEAYILNQWDIIKRYPFARAFLQEGVPELTEENGEGCQKVVEPAEVFEKLTHNIDPDLFKEDISINHALDFITWCIDGYIDRKLNNQDLNQLEYEDTKRDFEGLIEDLRKIHYR